MPRALRVLADLVLSIQNRLKGRAEPDERPQRYASERWRTRVIVSSSGAIAKMIRYSPIRSRKIPLPLPSECPKDPRCRIRHIQLGIEGSGWPFSGRLPAD